MTQKHTIQLILPSPAHLKIVRRERILKYRAMMAKEAARKERGDPGSRIAKTIATESDTAKGLREILDADVTGHNVEAFLLERGYHVIGSGCFGTVFAKDDTCSSVIKIGGDPMGWAQMAKRMLLSGNTNPHLPRIQSLTIWKTGYICRMERLQGWEETDLNDNQEIRSGLATILRRIMDSDQQPLREVAHPRLAMITDLMRDACAFWEEVTRGVSRRSPDLHAENLMCRADGTMVMTDAVAVHRA